MSENLVKEPDNVAPNFADENQEDVLLIFQALTQVS